MTPGQRLRQAREAKHISIGDIARRTFIQTKFLQAIDDDNLGAIPDTHRRLFIREYARSVGVVPEEIYALLDDYVPPPPAPHVETPAVSPEHPSSFAPTPAIEPLPESERRINREILKRLSSGRGVKLGGGGVAGWLIRGAILLLLVIGGYFLINSLGGSKGGSGMAGLDSTADGQAQVLPRAGDSAADVTDSAAAAVTGDSLTLEGRATGRVWFAIVSDGKKSQQGPIDSGEVKTWRAAESFRLSVSNAGGLQLSLNGKSLGTLGPLRTSVRNQIIDVNGVKGRSTTPPPRPASSSTTPAPSATPRAATAPARRPATTPTTTAAPTATTRRRSTSTTPSRTNTTSSRRRPAAVITPTQPRGPALPPSTSP